MADLAKHSAAAYVARLLSFTFVERPYQVAWQLVSKFGSVDGVVGAVFSELMEIDGMTESAAMLLRVTGAISSRRVTEDFTLGRTYSDEELQRYLVGLFIGSTQETVYMFVLDEQKRITVVEHMGGGTIGRSEVYPRKLLELAIKHKARSVILAHNHPRGGVMASEDDVTATRKLIDLFTSVGIELAVHYVVACRDVEPVVTEEEEPPKEEGEPGAGTPPPKAKKFR